MPINPGTFSTTSILPPFSIFHNLNFPFSTISIFNNLLFPFSTISIFHNFHSLQFSFSTKCISHICHIPQYFHLQNVHFPAISIFHNFHFPQFPFFTISIFYNLHFLQFPFNTISIIYYLPSSTIYDGLAERGNSIQSIPTRRYQRLSLLQARAGTSRQWSVAAMLTCSRQSRRLGPTQRDKGKGETSSTAVRSITKVVILVLGKSIVLKLQCARDANLSCSFAKVSIQRYSMVKCQRQRH